MNISSIIYLDASVWLAFFRKKEDYAKAKELLEKIEKSDDVIFYSSLVLLEIIDVIRKKYPERICV